MGITQGMRVKMREQDDDGDVGTVTDVDGDEAYVLWDLAGEAYVEDVAHLVALPLDQTGSIKCRDCDLIYRQEHGQCPRCTCDLFADINCPVRVVMAMLRARDALNDMHLPGMRRGGPAAWQIEPRRALNELNGALSSLGIGEQLTAKDFRG